MTGNVVSKYLIKNVVPHYPKKDAFLKYVINIYARYHEVPHVCELQHALLMTQLYFITIDIIGRLAFILTRLSFFRTYDI